MVVIAITSPVAVGAAGREVAAAGERAAHMKKKNIPVGADLADLY
jgi:hypothetical protein